MIFDGRIDSELFFDGVAQTIRIHTGIACMQDLRWQWIEHFVWKGTSLYERYTASRD